ACLREDFLFPIEQQFDLVFYFLRNFPGLGINADSSRQVECVTSKNGVAERGRYRSAPELDHFACRLWRRLRKRSSHRKNCRYRQDRCQKTNATSHVPPPFEWPAQYAARV